jgi:catechol 2,3-dioxygenase-like lactoylglutathione lyase family enzyme
MSETPFEQNMTFFYSDEMEETSAFFRDKLGLPMVLDQGVCHIFQVSPTGFLGVCNKKDRPRGTKGVMFTFLTDDLARDYKLWLERGVEFDGPPSLSGSGNVHSVFFRDPNGYMLELQEFRDPRWPYPGGRGPRTGPPTV